MTAVVLALAGALYVAGWLRIRARDVCRARQASVATPERTLPLGRAIAYGAGLALIALALLSPLDRASDVWFSAHMGQHELLVLFAAPLVVVGRPELVMRAALPVDTRGQVRAAVHSAPVAATLRVLGNRWFALVVHGVIVWLWHLPVLFEAALRDESVHALQHLSFFATSALFWWAMIRGRYGRLGYGLAVVFVFVTALHKGLLAMLFTVSGKALYPTHVARTEAMGHDALDDQVLAGVLMWVPAGVVMAGIAVGLLVAWLGALERRALS